MSGRISLQRSWFDVPEEIRTARTVNNLIHQTWALAVAGAREATSLARHLEFVINEYEDQGLTSLPPSTVWLAHEIVSSVDELCK